MAPSNVDLVRRGYGAITRGHLHVRPMEDADLDAAAAISAAAFGFDLSGNAARELWQARVAYTLDSDPGGCFVAERAGRVIGAAQAMRRERLWCLSLFAVAPHAQGTGAGRALIERALSYEHGTDAGLIVSSNDSRALRLYARAGFSLRPAFDAEGPVDRRALPRADPRVREAASADLEALAAISRDVRGAPHTAEVRFAMSRGARLLALEQRGFAVVQPGYGVWLLAARDEGTATALLWSALGLSGVAERAAVRWIVGGQDWAIKVVVEAGLRLTAAGALCVRGAPGPLHPFVPSGPFA